MSQKIEIDAQELSRIVTRIAHEIVEINKGTRDMVLVGILNRGVPLAQRIAKIIEKAEGVKIPVGALDVSLHRDDIMKKGSDIEVKRSDMPFSIDGKTVVLVDDVIFAGRTIRAAMDSLADYGRAAKIQLVALIDRDHRELPIHPDITGKKVSTTIGEEVIVNLTEIDGVDKVVIK